MKRLKIISPYQNFYQKAKGNINEYFRNKRRERIRKKFLLTVSCKNINKVLPFTVHMMLCKRDLEMAMCSAKAFNNVMGDGMRYRFHDDGSLDETDVIFVEKHLPGTKVILRREADQRAQKELSEYPKILEYRKNQIMSLKIIDVTIWGEGDRFCYVDSDVLFFKKPDFFIKALKGEIPKNYFNKDIQNAYMQTPDAIESFLNIRPLEKANAGLWVMNRADINLDTIESWLNNPGFKKSLYGYTLDQTFISMLANNSEGGAEHLPSTYDVNFFKKPEVSVCKHYVGAVRHGYELEGLLYLMNGDYGHFVS